ncbi:HAD family phosphatase [Clostridium frigoris]|uniref:HAD family phosphatase n=1 Tax=Clostridium frigoris TaxID=205327 RepID=A0ABS6BPV8_9CLOT|nr:HAD family phosphatase [Clostridium frigoris]MBU3158535.1 HAD family phosphatase [Clostridium frigoris]
MRKFGHAIFDMDGTMMDSMQAWKNLGRDYLIGKGIKAPENLNEIINAMSMTESANYFRGEFGIRDNVLKIISDINEIIEDMYMYEIPLKPYANEYLLKLKREGVIMCVVTAAPLQLAKAALKRLEVLKYFSFVVCCDEVGVGKSEPDSYYLATKKMGADISDVVVYEDADYAMKTAKDAGFYTIGVYNEGAGKSKEEMQLLCDRYIDSFECLL